MALCWMPFQEPRLAHSLGHLPGRQQSWRPTKVRCTDSSTIPRISPSAEIYGCSPGRLFFRLTSTYPHAESCKSELTHGASPAVIFRTM